MDFWTQFRFIAFLVGLVLFTGLGLLLPRRQLTSRWIYRYGHNLLLGGVNPILVRIFFGWGLVEWTLWVEQNNWGLLNQFSLPSGVSAFFLVVALDGIIYWQHVLTHKIHWLWRLHRVHHSDVEFDTSTALRFHFVEIAFSYLVKTAAITLIGGPVLGVVLFEVILNFSAMFNHANLKLGLKTDACLRWLLVTPDFHRVHHSPLRFETDSNYGFCLSLWDYLFGTYRAQPEKGHEQMEIGLQQFRGPGEQNFAALWVQPLKKTPH